MTGKTLIDCHVHLAALPDGDNGYVLREIFADLPRPRHALPAFLCRYLYIDTAQSYVACCNLRRYPEIYKHLLFGTDYPLSVFHVAAWDRVAFGALRDMIRTKNRFDRQVAVCHGLKIGFRSLGDLLPQPTAKTMP